MCLINRAHACTITGRRIMKEEIGKTAAIKAATSKVSKVYHLGTNWVANGPKTCMELSEAFTNYEEATLERRKWIAEIALESLGYDEEDARYKFEAISDRWTVAELVNHYIRING
jgi:hypothetical protein